MAKSTKGTHFVISAGLTASGAPVYLKADGGWSLQLADARPIESKEEAEQLVSHADQHEQALVCDPYMFAVRLDGNAIDPLSARENIRAKGPSTPIRRPD